MKSPMSQPTKLGTRVLSGIAAGLLALGPLTPAWAHDAVIGGSIADGDVLSSFPERITVEFSAIPQAGFNTMAVSDVDSGELYFSGEPQLNDRELSIDTPADLALGDGHYQLGFRIVSSDGHATTGGLRFEVASGTPASTTAAAAAAVDPAADPSATAAPAADSREPELSGAMRWMMALGSGMALVAVAAMFFACLL